jgi:hypothetical protein
VLLSDVSFAKNTSCYSNRVKQRKITNLHSIGPDVTNSSWNVKIERSCVLLTLWRLMCPEFLANDRAVSLADYCETRVSGF